MGASAGETACPKPRPRIPLPPPEVLRIIDRHLGENRHRRAAGAARCRACGILIGPDHVETQGRDGLCSSCWKEEHGRWSG